ncbi:GOLM1 protein, partial [Neodrepanis coruscans]|nr:GOLM1 protein [Neodrepanis coruscans]
EHLKELRTEYGKLQLDVYWVQKNRTNLERKFSYDLSQCINQMKELKEQCEERIDELSKKGHDIPQIKENKDFSNDSKKYSQVNIQLPALKQTLFKQTDLEQQKSSEDVPKAVPTERKTHLMQDKERIDGPADIRKEEPKAEEELFSQLKKPQDSLKAAASHKEMLPQSEKEPNPSEDEKHVAGQDTLQPAAEQAASEEIDRGQLLNDDAKQDDFLPGKADKQEHETVNQDKDVDYNLDENEAESETDKQAALAGIENGKKEKKQN